MSNPAPPNKITDAKLLLKIKALEKGVKNCKEPHFKPDKLKHKYSSHHHDTKELEHQIKPHDDQLSISVEINHSNRKNFKFKLASEQISFPFFRYDSVGSPHRNRRMPLGKKDSVPCPHFNGFDEDGYSVAYKTSIIEKQGKALEFVDFALNHFFKEANIDSAGVNPTVTLPPQLFDSTSDNPLDGVTF